MRPANTVLVEGGGVRCDWSQMAIAVCNRHFGVGADGLLVLLPSEEAHLQMRVFDPDGSEAEACGNGLRCVVRYALHKGLIDTKAQELSVETISGVRKARLHTVGGKVATIQVGMGKPKFGAKDIPVVIKQGEGSLVDIKSMLSYPVTIRGVDLLLNLVSMGNPHAIYFWQQPVSDFPLSELGPEVERLAIFPNRVNFEVARVVNQRQIEARVWERGVGETLACGSGACAIAVSAQLYDYVDSRVDMKLRGGNLEVEWGGVGEVFLSGPAEIVFSGEWPDENVKTS